jgi:hypothetical protein
MRRLPVRQVFAGPPAGYWGGVRTPSTPEVAEHVDPAFEGRRADAERDEAKRWWGRGGARAEDPIPSAGGRCGSYFAA